MISLRSVPGIADVHTVRGALALPGAPADLVIEIPHGATATADFDTYAAAMVGELPEGLVDFFHVNTDVGAFEVGMATCRALVALRPGTTAAIVRARIPRTFIDCNRRIDADAAAFREGGVTPGLMPWSSHPEDAERLVACWRAYQALADETIASAAPGRALLLLHTYSARTVDVQVDEDIVANLRRAWSPDVVGSWPLRPELDVIARTVDGEDLAPRALVDDLRDAFATLGWTLADSATYPLHPSTMAWDRVRAHPGRALCLEVRRDLLTDPFLPFDENVVPEALAERVAGPLARAMAEHGWCAENPA